MWTDTSARTWPRADRWVLLAVGLLIAAAAVVGHLLNRAGVELALPAPPLIAYWSPHVGWGSPLVVACLAYGVGLQRRAASLRWRRLLVAGWLLNLGWMMSLTLVDGLDRGWTQVLLNPNEYLHDLPRITDPLTFLRTFTDFIAVGGTTTEQTQWTTHVAGHPPLATLLFWTLHQVGLGGGFWAGALCILVASLASVALPVAVSQLGAPDAARRLVPYLALFPGAVWMAVSADGLFAGVACSGLALACRGAVRRRWGSSVVGGLLLGTAVFLSYGLVLFGVVVATALLVSVARGGWRRVLGPWIVSATAALAVALAHLALGFSWFDGLRALHIRYYQGIAATRPYGYFVWANLAAWMISCSPVVAVGLSRAVGVLRHARSGWSQDRVVALLAVSGLTAALLADASALSKAETERIWLSFGLVAGVGLALLRGRAATVALVGAAGCAIAVNHLFSTGW